MKERLFMIESRYVVDTVEHTLLDTKTGSSVVIGANGTNMLSYMMSNPNTPLSKASLIQEVWEKKGLIVEESSLLTCISLCRKYLQDKDGKIIKTIRGVGYQFTASIEPYSVSPGLLKAGSNEDNPTAGRIYLTAYSRCSECAIRLLINMSVFTVCGIASWLGMTNLVEPWPSDDGYSAVYSRCSVIFSNAELENVRLYQLDETDVYVDDNGNSISMMKDGSEVLCE